MIVLPIVERELRVRARQKATYRVRCIAVAVALLLAAPWLILSSAAAGGISSGKPIFTWLTALALVYCLFEGSRQTSDSLSEEKREGTLGLLFLTDLKGYDVVLGKLAATSLHSFYGLVAVAPVLCLSVLAGGVSGGEFGRITLLLVCTLLFGLTAGLWVSAHCKDEQKALLRTWLLVLAAVGGLPLLEWFLGRGGFQAATASWSLGSPGFACYMAFDANYGAAPHQFWLCLLFLLLGSAGLLYAASVSVVRHVQEVAAEPVAVSSSLPNECHEDPFTRVQLITAAARRKKFIELNPVLWLAIRNQRSVTWLWVLAIWLVLVRSAQAVAMSPSRLGGGLGPISAILLTGFSAAVHLVFWYLTASVASRCLVEARRSGALEILLSTPLKTGDWLRGQWLALRGQLAGPAALLVISNWIPMLLLHFEPASPTLNLNSSVSIGFPIGISLLVMLADVVAVGWVGMWLALSTKRPGQAAPKTFATVILLPWLICSGFPVGFLVNGLVSWDSAFVIASTLVMLVKDWFFINWARGKLYWEFRDMAAMRCSGTPLASRPTPETDYSEDFALLGSPNANAD